MHDIAEIITDGLIEKERIKQLKTKKKIVIENFSNGFKKFYCPNCKEELHMKIPICSCKQNLEWGNDKPYY